MPHADAALFLELPGLTRPWLGVQTQPSIKQIEFLPSQSGFTENWKVNRLRPGKCRQKGQQAPRSCGRLTAGQRASQRLKRDSRGELRVARTRDIPAP